MLIKVNPLVKTCIFQIISPMAILFSSAGTLDWPMAWLLIGILAFGTGLNTFVVLSNHPDLIAERSQFGTGSKKWDKVLAPIAGLYGPAITMLVCGLNHRFNWSGAVPILLQRVSILGMLLGYGLVIWAVASNKFFSSFVRIQTDRGHMVINHGPYSRIRHPGYLGLISILASMPLMLDSWISYLPSFLTICITIIRLVLEDRTLKHELYGYKEYAGQVRYRLLPGIW